MGKHHTGSDAVRPGIVRTHAHATSRATLDRDEQAVIVRRAVISIRADETVVASLDVILEKQSPPLVRVARRRTCRINNAGDRAWAAGNVNRIVAILQHPEVHRIAPDVAGGCDPLRGELPLNAERP